MCLTFEYVEFYPSIFMCYYFHRIEESNGKLWYIHFSPIIVLRVNIGEMEYFCYVFNKVFQNSVSVDTCLLIFIFYNVHTCLQKVTALSTVRSETRLASVSSRYYSTRHDREHKKKTRFFTHAKKQGMLIDKFLQFITRKYSQTYRGNGIWAGRRSHVILSRNDYSSW